ncbi:MAG: M6 family metalloprotease domain-containing protein [Endomicrobia bacterium]|nr:M6 family metalloprotease domain-containing protein [Endomicrobiia bacterium]
MDIIKKMTKKFCVAVKVFLSAVFISSAAVSLSFAEPAYNNPIDFEQPDGTKVTIRLFGDEFYSWAEDSQGYTVLQDAQTKEWVYAEQDANGSLRRTSHRVGRASPQSLGLRRSIKDRDFEQIRQRNMDSMRPAGFDRRDWMKPQRTRSFGDPSAEPSGGEPPENPANPIISGDPANPVIKKPLVILVQFADTKFTTPNPQASFQNLMTQPGYAGSGYSGTATAGSVKDYFSAASYGNYIVDSVVSVVITLDETSAWYVGNSRYQYVRSHLVPEALRKLEATGFNFAQCATNGWLDSLTIIYAGRGQSSGGGVTTIWPHASYYSGNTTAMFTAGGIRIRGYNCSNELRSVSNVNRMVGPGTITHEVSHELFGLPDLYDTSSTATHEGVGEFCLMSGGSHCGNGYTPPLWSAWCKKSVGVTALINLPDNADITILDSALNDNNIYKFKGPQFWTGTNGREEYFLIENRNGGGFDTGIPQQSAAIGRGLLIWHIDESQTNNNSPQAARLMVGLEEANGQSPKALISNRRPTNVYFKSSSNASYNFTSFTDNTNPNSISYTGQLAGKPITLISAPGNSMTFRVGSGGGVPLVTGTIDSITPDSSKRGLTVNVEMNGANLLAGSTAKLVRGTSTITANSVTYNSSSRLTASFAIPSAAAIGYWDLVVSSAGYVSDIMKPEIFFVQGNMSISNVTPNTGYSGTALTLNVTGTDFQSGAGIKLTNGSTVINGSGVTLSGSTGMTASFAIPSSVANNTKFDLTITNASGDHVTSTQAVTIYALTITSFTPTQANAGETVNLTVNGTGFIAGQSKITLKNASNENITITPSITSTTATQIRGTFTATAGTWRVYAAAYENGPEIAAASNMNITVTGTVDTIEPESGRRNTTVNVEINGTNLLAGSTVRLTRTGSTAITAASVTYNSSNKLTAAFNIPNNAAIGYWDLVISSSGYASDITKTGIFFVLGNSMAITGVTPSSGTIGTTLNLTVTGADFQNGVTVKLTSGATVINGTNVSRNGNTRVSASFAIPPNIASETKFDLTVTNTSGDYITQSQAVTVYSAALVTGTINSITPAESKRGVTVNVEINGANLLAGSTAKLIKGTNTITANSVTYNSSSRLTASFTIPSAAQTGYWDLAVSSTGYSGDIMKPEIFLVQGDMSINNVTPGLGIRGTTLNLSVTGTDFQSGAGIKLTNGSTVINGTGVTLNGTAGISAAFAIPSTAANGTQFDLTVTNASGDYVTKTQAVTIYGAPAITNFMPLQAIAGERVNLTVNGTGFINGHTKIVLKNASNESQTIIPSITSVSGTQITGTFNAVAGTWKLYAAAYENGPEYAAAGNFNVMLTGKMIDSIIPDSSKRGVTVNVEIIGTSLLEGSTVKLIKGTNTITANSVTYNSSNKLTASFDIPGTAAIGYWDLAVSSTGYASDIMMNGIFLVQGDMAISSVTPGIGIRGTTLNLSVTGTDFQSGANIELIGDTVINGTGIAQSGTTGITASFAIPSGTANGTEFDLTVTNASGDHITKTNAVTIYDALTITSFAPAEAKTGDTVNLTVNGTGFINGYTKVVLKNASDENIKIMPDIMSVSATQITGTFAAITGTWKVYAAAYDGGPEYAAASNMNITPDNSTAYNLFAYAGAVIMFPVISKNGVQNTGMMIIPERTFSEDVKITIYQQTGFAQTESYAKELRHTNIAVYVDAQGKKPEKEIELRLPYNESDITEMDEDRLGISMYDEGKNVWMPLKSKVDKENKLVTVNTEYLSVFAIMGTANAVKAFEDVKYYPNPIRPSKGANYSKMHFSNIPAGTQIKIYTLLGQTVRNLEADAGGTAVWDGKNNAGEKAASGVYIAYMEDKNGNKKKIKIAVER